MASFVYDSFLTDTFIGGISSAGTFKCALLTSGYAPNRATHTRFSQITNEVVAAGYTAGGQVTVPVVSYDGSDHKKTKLTFPALQWTADLTARYAVVYRSTGVASTSELVYLHDFLTDAITNAGGILTVDVSVLSVTVP